MKHLCFRLTCLVLPLATLLPARAALNPAIIPADSRWVVYVDLNALRASTIGKELVAFAEKNQFPVADMKVGVDVEKLAATIGTVTAFGANFAKDPSLVDGTLVIQGTPDLRKIAEGLLLQATIAEPKRVTEAKDLPFPGYTISSPPPQAGGEPKIEVFIAFPPEPVVLVSKSRAQLLHARELLGGGAPSIAKSVNSPLVRLLKPSANAIIFAASVVPSEQMFPNDGPQARILQMTNSASLALGEEGIQTFAHAELVAASSANADKLMKILQGLTAMMSLAETNDKQLADFLNSAAVSRDADTVTLHVAYTSSRLAEMVKNIQAQMNQTARPTPPQGPSLVSGKPLAQWTAEASTAVEGSGPPALSWRTIENVSLTNGALVSLGRATNGGRVAKFDRVEVSAPEGGMPLIFKTDFMRTGGPRGNLQQFQFPGADGTYTLKVAYVNDPDGKAAYAVSVRNPPPSTPAPASAK